MTNTTDVLEQMSALVAQWQDAGDDKVLFLDCYRMMTGNVLSAIQAQEFKDQDWVGRLLTHFADYYFEALQDYQFDPDSAPQAWQLAHNAAADPHVTALQKLLLGVNVHINYDLVLTLVEILQPCVTFNRKNTYDWYRERVYNLAETEHDPSDRIAAFQKALEWGERIPTGIFYQTQLPTYEEQVAGLAAGPVARRNLQKLSATEVDGLRAEMV